jgi:glycosyltransferase involved in cell wall biosynthesis
MKLNLLIATIDGGIRRVAENLPEPFPGVNFIVSHQVTAEQFRTLPAELKRPDVAVTVLEGKGLSRNRNNAILIADGDIALLADDDAIYRPEHFERVFKAFEDDSEVDVACFKIATPAGEVEYKNYSPEPYCLNEESRHYISSLEIAFRVASVKEKKICFDQRFGLGSGLIRSGEEAVFIFDCIRAGLRVCYIPTYVVEHARESTTNAQDQYSEERVVFKGAYDARRYGWKAVPAVLLETVRKRRQLYASGKRPSAYLRERLRGAFYILRK